MTAGPSGYAARTAFAFVKRFPRGLDWAGGKLPHIQTYGYALFSVNAGSAVRGYHHERMLFERDRAPLRVSATSSGQHPPSKDIAPRVTTHTEKVPA